MIKGRIKRKWEKNNLREKGKEWRKSHHGKKTPVITRKL